MFLWVVTLAVLCAALICALITISGPFRLKYATDKKRHKVGVPEVSPGKKIKHYFK